jgi:hypothetical protein
MSPRKYDAVLAGLRPAPPSNPSFQERVDKFKTRVVNLTPNSLAQTYISLRREQETLQEKLSNTNVAVEALAQLLIASQEAGQAGWGDYGVSDYMMRLQSGDTLNVQRIPYGTVTDREAFRLWCIANGYERQLQLQWKVRNELVKERLLAGESEPDGIEIWSKATIKFTPKKEEPL